MYFNDIFLKLPRLKCPIHSSLGANTKNIFYLMHLLKVQTELETDLKLTNDVIDND